MNISDYLNQKAVYWGTPTKGQWGTTFADPIEIDCRWQFVMQQFVDPSTGKTHVSRAIVYCNQDLDLDGYLWPGELSELDSGIDSPVNLAEAHRIRSWEKSPDLKAEQFLRKAIL
jgi:hypothetical protein